MFVEKQPITWLKKMATTALLLAGLAVTFTSCVDDTTEVDETFILTETTIGSETYTKVEGNFNVDYTLDSDTKWLLSGGIFVEDGATLTIEAGTTIYAADDATTPFLAIAQGAKIMANGTATSPIVMTSIKKVTGSPVTGEWGGVIVNGYASINTGETAQGEGNTGVYGGNDDADNSGVIRYVIVEYAGKQLGADNELNGFSFNGVGSGTIVEYVQAYKGADDGFEFFGGTVNVKYAVSTGNGDDSFDWTHGWRGNGQFWVANQSTTDGDRGFEADNNGDDNTASPYSNPTISNVTLLGANDGDNENTGMRLREGTKGKIYNAIVTGFPKNGVRVSGETTTTNMDNGDLIVKSTISSPLATAPWKDCAAFENDATNATSGAGLNGFVGTVTDNATDASTLGAWFTGVTYIGAVPTNNNWTAGWTTEL